MMALRGSLKFKNTTHFPSLAPVYTDRTAWRFGFDGLADHRLTYRLACANDADCGGAGPCGPNHCLGSGLCAPLPAADFQACPAGKCCGGACAGTCTAACK